MMTDSVALLLLRTTLCTMLAAAMAALLLRRMHYRSPRLQRIASILVLLQGWMFFPLVLELPTKTAAPAELHNDILVSKDQPARTESYWRTSAVEVAPASPEAVVVPVNWSAIIWASGAVAVVLWFVRRYALLLHRVPLGRRPTQEEWSREWQHVADELGVGARAQFRISQELGPLLCFVPFFYLVLCPELLWTALDVNQRKAILKHELAHVKRHDLWKSIGIRLLALPQWFNPLAWMAVRAFDEAAEWACDDLVMTDCGQASDTSYPLALLRIAESRSEPLPGAVAARGGVLSTRIRRLVEPSFREEKKMFKVLLPVLLVGMVCVQSVRVETVAADKPQGGYIENEPTVVSGDTSESPSQQSSEARKADLARTGLDPYRVEPTDIITIQAQPVDRKSPAIDELSAVDNESRPSTGSQSSNDADGPRQSGQGARPSDLLFIVYNVTELVFPCGKPAFTKEGRLPPDKPCVDFVPLVELITSTISPSSWQQVGGAGAIETFSTNHSIVVSQTRDVQDEIARLLNHLRKLSQEEAVLEAQYLRVPDEVLRRCGIQGKQIAAISADEKNTLLSAIQNDAHGRIFAGPIAKLFNGQGVVLNSSFRDTTGGHRKYSLQALMDDERTTLRVAASALGDNGQPHSGGVRWKLSNGEALLFSCDQPSAGVDKGGVEGDRQFILVTGHISATRR